jgi:hypothetical protein
MTWIKVPTGYQFKRRMAIARLNRRTLKELGMDTQLFISCDNFNEEFVRKILATVYEGVANWQLHGVFYEYAYDAVDVVVSSPDFEEIEDGVRLEVLPTKQESQSCSSV